MSIAFRNYLRILNVHNPIKFVRRQIHHFVLSDTIFSLSSGSGKCGVAVIRVSGASTSTALKTMANLREFPSPRLAVLKKLKHSRTGDIIDRGLILWFPGPFSFTGEDTCEFQVHGGPAIIAAMLDSLNNIPGLRPAKPGEFTKRAFFNGKLDLTEVEGLADLIHAETELQRKQALLQSSGSLSELYNSWRERLIRCIAHMEAYIDFSEDENIESNVLDKVNVNLSGLETEMINHLNDNRRGERLRDGVRTVVVGAPNVGKSSFLNLICQRPISIVTSIAGTTRDLIETPFNICGYPVIFADTAGLRSDSQDPIEMEGITRALDYTKSADFIILLVNAEYLRAYDFNVAKYREDYLMDLGLSDFKDCLKTKKILTIINKIDLIDYKFYCNKLKNFGDDCAVISCKDNTGLEEVVRKISDQLKILCGTPTAECPTISQQRHRQLISSALCHIQEYTNETKNLECCDMAIVAQYLRKSLHCLGQITGEVNSEEILDVIFCDFCIGK